MAGQKGRDVLIKIGDGGAPEAFTSVAGIRAKTISLNARTVDGTSGESVEAWRELIAGAGVKAARSFQLIIPDFGTLAGPFLVESLDYAGDHDGEAAFAITLASAGVLSFTAL
jgi:predicted secreted protein